MIRLTRLNHAPLVLNSELIEHIESTPDTVITLINGQVFMVLESSDEVIQRVAVYQRSIYAEALRCPYQPRAEGGGDGDSGRADTNVMPYGR